MGVPVASLEGSWRGEAGREEATVTAALTTAATDTWALLTN